MREVPRWAALGFGCLVVGSFATILGAANQSQALWGSIRWLAVSVVALAAFQMLRDNENASARCADIFSATAILVAGFALLAAGRDLLDRGTPVLRLAASTRRSGTTRTTPAT